MSDSNAGKNQIGKDAQVSLGGWLKQAKKAGYIKEYYERHRDGYAGHSKTQFYAPFLIEFKNGDRWILYSTTSLRDRVKEDFWDAENLKAIDPTIVKAFLIYPDGRPQKVRDAFASFNKRIEDRTIYSPLDGAIPFATFQALVVSIGTAGKSSGYIAGAEGRAFEVRVANSLRNKANLRVLKGKPDDSIPVDIGLLDAVLDKISLDPRAISFISSSADREDIGTLPSGGSPKTDVLANIFLDSGDQSTLTISCKKTGASSVTIGQHKADDIALAVDPLNTKLKTLLNKFQVEGTLSAMSSDEIQELTDELAPMMKTFCRFIIGGVGGPGDPNKHWAKYVMVCRDDPDDFKFYTLDEYIDELLSKPRKHFGTPFSWTYASGSKGNDIQFKVDVTN